MKNVLTKIGYMAMGCLLTLIGYYFGNVEHNSVSAQQASENAATEIVGTLRVRQLEIVDDSDTPHVLLDKNSIKIYNENGERLLPWNLISIERVSRGVAITFEPKTHLDDNEAYNLLGVVASKEWLNKNTDYKVVKFGNNYSIRHSGTHISVTLGGQSTNTINGITFVDDANGNIRVALPKDK